MSANLFDAGDFQRLDRERTLIEQRERLPAEPDRSPIEEPIQDKPFRPESLFDLMLDGMMEALQRRMQNG